MTAQSVGWPLPSVASNVEGYDAETVLATALRTLGRDRLALAASFGPEDVVLIDLLCRIEARPRVFTLDTGRLPNETYELIERLRRHFDIDIEIYFPDAAAVEAMVRTRGLNLFYASLEDRRQCCEVRKVAPLRRALATVDGWVTGLRREQTPTRARTPKISLDLEHGSIWKVAPLADWTEAQVWRHIRANDLPYHALHDRGFSSIGCEPCTREVAPGEDSRSGRWWWEGSGSRECGLHVEHAELREVVTDAG